VKRKIKSIGSILKLVSQLRREGKSIGFTNGCFDILHPGHVSYLRKAKKYVDVLILGLNSDRSVKKNKGPNRPFNNEKDRAEVVAGLEAVDYVVIFDAPTPYDIIKKIKPDYLFKGGDWRKQEVVGRDILESYGGKVVIVPYLKGYSTTSMVKKICRKACTG